MKKFYSCRYDKTFKEVFLNPKNEDLLKALLEDILGVNLEIKGILPTELIVGNNVIKSKRVDALILSTNKKIEIEINASISEYVYVRNTAYICNIYSNNALVGDTYDKDVDIIQINLTWGLDYEENKREFRLSDKAGNNYVENLLIMEINMEYYKKIWYSKDEKKIKENQHLVMLDLNEGELKAMPKSDKISKKYVESVTIVNNDPFFQEYMSHEEDQRKMQNSLIKDVKDKGVEYGKSEGIKVGQEQGKKEEKIDIARRLIKSGMSLEEVSKYTKIDINYLKVMPKSDKISKKYVESVTIVNNDPKFQEYMSHEEDQGKMQNSLIKDVKDKGVEYGKKEEKIDIARRLIKSGMSLEEVSKYTKIDINYLKAMPKSDKISKKYVESVTIVNNDPKFQEYMSHEEDQGKMQNSLIKDVKDKGVEYGKSEGIKVGQEQEKIKIAKSLIKSGMSLEEVSKHTKMDIDILKKYDI